MADTIGAWTTCPRTKSRRLDKMSADDMYCPLDDFVAQIVIALDSRPPIHYELIDIGKRLGDKVFSNIHINRIWYMSTTE